MKINELEKELGITRANVRFYEEQGLISPNRGSNNYREYDDYDVRMLKIIIMLRKLDVSILEIKELFEGDIELKEILGDKMSELLDKTKSLKTALDLCMDIYDTGYTINNIDPDRWLDEMNKAGQDKNSFKNILNDISEDYKKTFLPKLLVFAENPKQVLLSLLVVCFFYAWMNSMFNNSDSWINFVHPLLLITFSSIIYFIFSFIKYKNKKLFNIANKILLYSCLTFLILIFLLIIVLILNNHFHFWY